MGYTSQQFIKEIWPYVLKYAPQYNIKVASPVLAQAVIESRNGNSLLAKYNNFFGLKCGRNWPGRSINMTTHEEYQPGEITKVKDNFRVYDTIEQGIKGYFEFIQYSRYKNLKGETDPLKYIEKIKADGYATSSTYVETVWNTVVKLGLTKYDDLLSKGIEGESVKEPVTDYPAVDEEPEYDRNNILIDGIDIVDGKLCLTGKNLSEIKELVKFLEALQADAEDIKEVLECLN